MKKIIDRLRKLNSGDKMLKASEALHSHPCKESLYEALIKIHEKPVQKQNDTPNWTIEYYYQGVPKNIVADENVKLYIVNFKKETAKEVK